MADSEMRALGIAAKFGNAFAKQGGTLDMLKWLADDSEMMRDVVKVADRRLLEHVASQAMKFPDPHVYDPAECLSPGEHHGVRIASVIGGRHFVPAGQREVHEVFFAAYRMRRGARLGVTYNEMSRLKIKGPRMTVDHLWMALLYHKQSCPERPFLAMEGALNVFDLPLGQGVYFPVTAHLAIDGWHLEAIDSLTPDSGTHKGTHFILNNAG